MPNVESNRGTVIIATHGHARGRDNMFIGLLFRSIGGARPGLDRRVQLWCTGTALPPLEDVAAVVFLLADPISHFPACEAEATQLAEAARARGIRVLNPPEALNNTVKSRQAELWKAAGIPCAAGATAHSEDELRASLPLANYPVIIRSDDQHVQDGVSVWTNEADALKHVPRAGYPAAILEFVDTRAGWSGSEPGSIYADYFHKKRSMVFGSRVFNNHIFFGTDPIVGGKNCTFMSALLGGEVPRLDEMLRADIAYHWAPTEAPDVMQAALRALGLDIAAIDYSTMADGSVVLWEANPYFYLPSPHQGLLAGPRRLRERIPHMISTMIDELEALAGALAHA